MPAAPFPHAPGLALNESPSEKEGKFQPDTFSRSMSNPQ